MRAGRGMRLAVSGAEAAGVLAGLVERAEFVAHDAKVGFEAQEALVLCLLPGLGTLPQVGGGGEMRAAFGGEPRDEWCGAFLCGQEGGGVAAGEGDVGARAQSFQSGEQ
jgi:hypothetical protein